MLSLLPSIPFFLCFHSPLNTFKWKLYEGCDIALFEIAPVQPDWWSSVEVFCLWLHDQLLAALKPPPFHNYLKALEIVFPCFNLCSLTFIVQVYREFVGLYDLVFLLTICILMVVSIQIKCSFVCTR